MAKLVAVVTAYNRADFVGKCLHSVLEAADAQLEVQVILMDNGSSDNTEEVAQAVDERVRVMRTEDNRHVIGVINRGFEAAFQENPDYILLLNEDTKFTPGSLKGLVAASGSHPASIMTPLQINYRHQEQIDDGAFAHVHTVRPLLEDAVMGRPLKEVYPLPTIIGAAMFARREVWENCGEFDPLFWFYGVDDDMCTRARWLGYEILLVPEAHLFHAHGKLGAQDNQPGSAKIAAAHRKWRNELQARYLFRLKNPDYSLSKACLRTAGYAIATSFTCMRGLWPSGVLQALSIYADCLRQYPQIAETRKRHFDAARKIRENKRP